MGIPARWLSRLRAGARLNAGEIREALIRHLDWWSQLVIPEFEIGASRADVVTISKTGYATEYEIKVSYEDWRDDRKKVKWLVSPATGNQYVSRFFYVVPGRYVDLDARRQFAPAIKMPENLVPGAGLIVVIGGWCHEVTPAKRFKVPVVPPEIYRRAMDAFYYRFWRLERKHRDFLDDYRSLVRRLDELGAP